MSLLLIAAIGLVIGFLGGLLGKGGSAIATPLLHAMGVPAIVAVAAPLPATVPSTAVASYAYWRERFVDWRVVRWSIGIGVPCTVFGAVLTRWVGGGALVWATDLVLVALGLRVLLGASTPSTSVVDTADPSPAKLAAVAGGVGIVSGLLANSGGFLLAPLFITVLRLPIKAALATSLAVACVLAVPGTIVHAALGHIDWTVVAVFAATSVPFSFLGARIAIRTEAHRVERFYGLALMVLGLTFLAIS
ncbi:MAG TPA: sulfite exporter TauE/SafE family protein [Acidimicrobiia bacterium]|nr:sulfite exporter TauE/SafE family protein [Acidimicrobiia bacterium]